MSTPEQIAEAGTVTATFKPYDLTNTEADLHAHNGERVTVVEQIPLDHDEFTMHRIAFSDGTEAEAFDNELTERRTEA